MRGRPTAVAPSPKTTSFPSKSSTAERQSSRQSKPVSSTPDFSSGRISRQSKDSKLEGSSSESSISSGASLDEYEKESYTGSSRPAGDASTVGRAGSRTSKKAAPTSGRQMTSPASSSKSGSVKSPPPPTKPKPTSLFEYQPQSSGKSSSFQQTQQASTYQDGYSAPKITHASRKRVVTNADGSTIETEEILEPTTMTSHSMAKSKPVVVGVVPSTPASTYSRPDSVLLATTCFAFFLHSLTNPSVSTYLLTLSIHFPSFSSLVVNYVPFNTSSLFAFILPYFHFTFFLSLHFTTLSPFYPLTVPHFPVGPV